MMKNKTTLGFWLILASLTLTGCGVSLSSQSASSSALTSSFTPSSATTSSSENTSTTPISSSSGSGSTAVTSVSKDGVYQFYAVNDFHGSVLENSSYYYEGGLAKVGGKLKALKAADPEHTFIISSGDMWQGSLESNSNYGALVTEVMNNIGFDSMTIGNHEFDYGQSYIQTNRKAANFPFLAGNIRTYSSGSIGAAWDGSDISTVISRGGIKVGIVGMIGEGQTTSITSKNVSNLYFDDPKTYAETEASRLRSSEGCDIVVLSIHDPVAIPRGWEASGLKSYFDGVFCGHSHRKETSLSSGVPYLQGICNGEGISHFELTMTNGVTSCTNYEYIPASSSWTEDSEILQIEQGYIGTEEFTTLANKTCGTLSGSLTQSTVANAGCKAIYEKYKSSHSDLVLAMENSQRASLESGTISYSSLYKATPFMNKIVIAKVLGQDIMNEASYNKTYTGDATTYGTLNASTYYTVAVIDYLVYHQNIYKSYDYFPSLLESNVVAEYNAYPVDITFDYFASLGGTISASSFDDSATGFNLYK
jgi:5'-nucleotidase / UDP-sugar diphosphatase